MMPYLRSHENIVLLLIADGEVALRLLVLIRIGLQAPHRVAREHREPKLNV